MGAEKSAPSIMLVKDAVILIGLILVVLIIVFLYGVTIYTVDKAKGKKCPVCGVRGFYRVDKLLGNLCGNCERIKILKQPEEDDFLRRLNEDRPLTVKGK